MVKYTEFVKMNYDKVRSFPAKERMGKIAEMWRASGMGGKSKPKGDKPVKGGSFVPHKLKEPKHDGSNLTLVERNVPLNTYDYMTAPFGQPVGIGIGSRLEVAQPGLGLPDKMTTPFGTGSFRIGGEKSLPPKAKAKAKAKAKGGNMLGLPTPPLNLDLKGGGMLEDLNSIIAQAKGGKLKVKKDKPVHGGGWLSTGLSMIGLGLPVGMKDDGKLGKAKLAKLVAHVKKHKGPAYVKHLKGAGFWSDLSDGVSQGFSAVVNPALSIASHFL